jgi:hypothetical protein
MGGQSTTQRVAIATPRARTRTTAGATHRSDTAHPHCSRRAALQTTCGRVACHGTVVLRSAKPVRDRPRRKARVVELGRNAFTLAPNTTATVAIAVPSRMRALVRKLSRVGAVADVHVRDDEGNTVDDTVKLTLTR